MSIRMIDAVTVEVKTPKLTALFKGPRLVSLSDAAGRPLLRHKGDDGPPALELLFADGKPQAVGEGPYARVKAAQISQSVAHIYVEDVEGDACLRISTDSAGRLTVEPSAQTLRHGLGCVRWNVAGVAAGASLPARTQASWAPHQSPRARQVRQRQLCAFARRSKPPAARPLPRLPSIAGQA